MSNRFIDLGVRARTAEVLASRGIVDPFPIQSLVIPDALEGKDVLGRARTGSGKTLAFGLPIVQRLRPEDHRPSALVLVPTRELAVQVAEEMQDIAKAGKLWVGAAYGGVSIRDQADRVRKSHILVATPGRLEDLASRGMVKLDKIKVLVLDEADRMLDMGFQPQVDQIVRRLRGPRQTMFFSATLDGVVGHMAAAYTRDAILHEIDTEAKTVAEANHFFKPVPSGGKVEALVELLRANDGDISLVFVRTKRGADRLVRKLKDKGIRAGAMHGDMSQPARERAWARFESGKSNVLVATDVAARGLDLLSISHVINYDPPDDDKGYVHRVGRTARAGRSGAGTTLVTPEMTADIGRMAARLDLHEQFMSAGFEVPKPRVVYTTSRRRRGRGRRRR
jgi:ATP-dependent RNA helicase RhlE